MTLDYLRSTICDLSMVYICSLADLIQINGNYVWRNSYGFEQCVSTRELVTLHISHKKKLKTVERFWTSTIFP